MTQYELMIGDYVLDGDNVAQITGITCDGIIETTFNETSNIEVIHPIPLTPEILEKNGFKKDAFTNLSPDYYFNNDEYSICVNLNSTCDKSKSIWIEKRSNRFTVSIEESRHSLDKKPLYVYQLQHALRLCNIDKEIVL